MSGGGGSSGGSTTTTQNLPDWAQPYAQQILQRGSDLSNQAAPQYGGQTTAGLTAQQQQGIGASGQSLAQAGANVGQANDWRNQVLGNSGPSAANAYTGSAVNTAQQYADPSNNPYLASAINNSNNAITTAYNNTTAPQTLAQFRNAGAFGGSAQQQATANNEYQLGQALASNTSNIQNNAYNTGAQVASNNAGLQVGANQAQQQLASNNYFNNVGAQANAIGAASGANTAYGNAANNAIGAGTVAQQNNQDQLNSQYQQWYNSVNGPYSQLGVLSQALSAALGSGGGISTTSYNPGSGSTLGSLLGLGSLGLGLGSQMGAF
jgi:hypothetical protein